MLDLASLKARGSLFFLRHGQSQGNHSRIIQGRGDYPLSDKGGEQSLRAAEWFKGQGIELVLTSPLARARETARIVAETLGLAGAEVHEDLTELDTGIFTGLPMEELQAAFPEPWRRFQQESWEGVPGAERIAQLAERCERTWGHLLRLLDSGKSNILSVTHSGILQWIIKVTLGQRTWMPLFPVANCGICHFRLDNRFAGDFTRVYSEWAHWSLLPTTSQEET